MNIGAEVAILSSREGQDKCTCKQAESSSSLYAMQASILLSLLRFVNGEAVT